MLRQSFPDIMGDTATEQESGKFHDGAKTTLVIANIGSRKLARTVLS